MSRLGTTTWKGRNYDRLYAAKARVMEYGVRRPTIIDFGPGGTVDFLLDWLPEGNVAYHDGITKLRRGALKLVESALRKTGAFDLRTAEPEEIAHMFGDMSPERMYVIDKEPKVIAAVRRAIERNYIGVPVTLDMSDIEKSPVQYRGDIVVAYHSIERTGNPRISMDNLASSVNMGRFLSTTFEEYVPQGMERVEPGLYVKRR